MYDGQLTESQIQPVAYMRELHPANRTDMKFFMFAWIDGEPDYLIAVDGKAGGAWAYCRKHNQIFAIKGKCDVCLDAPVADETSAAQLELEALVQPLNKPL